MNPNAINVGGAHIKKVLEPLQDELKDWMDGAIEGVVIVSFGSVSMEILNLSKILMFFFIFKDSTSIRYAK